MLLSDDLSAAGFDQPFELLRGCHARITRMDALLLRLIDHVALKETQGRPKFPCSPRGAGRRADPGGAQEGTDAQAQQAADKVLRYFDVAAPLHHEDEELHVFPLLRASAAGWGTATTRCWKRLKAITARLLCFGPSCATGCCK